jgi:hypothetical protein
MLMRFDIPFVISLVEKSLPLSNWGFVESAKTELTVIYNSQWCRVKFVIDRDRTSDSLHVFYGRLNAIDNVETMEWNGEKCRCWHGYPDIKVVIEFLNGTSPQDAYQRRLKPLPFIQDYHNSELAKSISDHDEQALTLHAVIWKHYGLRFFGLFDLQHPDVWEQYLVYLKEYYRLDDEGSRAAYERRGLAWKPPFDPPQHKRC